MEKFSQFKLKRRVKLKEISTFRKVVKNSEEKKMHMVDWSITSWCGCRIEAYVPIKYERQQLQNQESFLSQDTLRHGFQHQQRVVHMQK